MNGPAGAAEARCATALIRARCEGGGEVGVGAARVLDVERGHLAVVIVLVERETNGCGRGANASVGGQSAAVGRVTGCPTAIANVQGLNDGGDLVAGAQYCGALKSGREARRVGAVGARRISVPVRVEGRASAERRQCAAAAVIRATARGALLCRRPS